MATLQDQAAALLAAGGVKVVIGYAPGRSDQRRVHFARDADAAQRLVLDESCKRNLAVYLNKPEVKALGKAAIVCTPAALRTILQLAAEKQLADGSVVALALQAGDGQVVALESFAAIEQHLAGCKSSNEIAARIAELQALPLNERFALWREHLANCIRCYACRAACPMCYCNRCIVDGNQPQWVPVASHELGNLEWHISRAMHLAGRCIGCGACTDACPVGVPLHLLNALLAGEVSQQFGAAPGMQAAAPYALSTFQTQDKAEFIR